MEIPGLNNRASELIAAGRLGEAEEVLVSVAALLAGRAAAHGPDLPTDLQAALDEFFYACHRVRLLWDRQSYRLALPFALRAKTLEDAVYAIALGEERTPELAFSFGAWAQISVLTRCQSFERAERAFAEVLADAPRFSERLRCNRAQVEVVLVAGLCVFFEEGTPAWLARGRPPVARAQELLPRPSSSELRYGYACFHSRIGEAGVALDWLERAIEAGADRGRARRDKDLRALRAHPRFVDLTTSTWWSFDSRPSGARIVVDGADTGVRTPGRVPGRTKGRYCIRLMLEGYADDTLEHEVTDEGCGLSYGAELSSLEEAARWERDRQRRLEDSGRAPDAAAIAKTRAFLGSGSDRREAAIGVERGTTYGLGLLRITVRGDGDLVVQHEPFGEPGDLREHRSRLPDSETERLFAAFEAEAFTELFVGVHTGVPDELDLRLALTNREGRCHSVSKFVQTEHRRFDALVLMIWEAVAAQVGPAVRERLTL